MHLRRLEIQGFRSFGATPQILELHGPLAVVWGANSHGKSSIAEAVEFLFTGTTTRAVLHRGAKSELAGSLRNVHLDERVRVYVEAVLEHRGGRSVVRRTLVSDLAVSGDCESVLTVDGRQIQSVVEVGMRLSDPPLQAPVLSVPSIRFIVSAGPQERAEYLKQVLDVADLDDVRAEIKRAYEALPNPATPALEYFRRCEALVPVLSADLRKLVAATDPTVVGDYYHSVLERLATHAGLPQPKEPATAIRAEIERRSAAVFPVSDLVPGQLPVLPAKGIDSIVQYQAAAASFLGASEAAADGLRRVLSLIDETVLPADCPVCLTPRVLTPERLDSMRAASCALANVAGLRKAAERELAAWVSGAQTASDDLARVAPRSADWDKPTRAARSADAARLMRVDGDPLSEVLSRGDLLRAAVSNVEEVVCALRAAVSGVSIQFDERRLSDLSVLKAAREDADAAFVTVKVVLEEYTRAAKAVRNELETAVSGAASTVGWTEVLKGQELLVQIPAEHREFAKYVALGRDVADALKIVERAQVNLLDEKFRAMSGDIDVWWQMMRPGECTQFGGLRRRGTGKRFVDVKAELRPDASTAGVEREAAAVLSESQAGALGLSMFLARVIRDDVGFLVLDDPVPAGDEEHRAAFASLVLEELITKRHIQVVIITYDRELKKRIDNLYGHLGIDSFHISLDNPSVGSTFTPLRDDLARLLAEAWDAAGVPIEILRPAAAQKARMAAERFCKDMLAHAMRTAGTSATSSDYDGKNLGELIPFVKPLLTKDRSHPGKLEHARTVLNPGSHDDTRVPAQLDLKTVLGDLKALKKAYDI